MPNANNDIENKEPKKEKTIKYGILAITAIIIAVLLMILGIYLYGQFHTSDEIKEPVKISQVVSVNI